MPRANGRLPTEIRPLRIVTGYLKDPEGSVLIETGQTWVVCTASIEERVPQWMKQQGKPGGWVTAEYAMLPRATTTRTQRGGGSRAREIERLIGRSLRAAIDLKRLGERTITIDCDVLQADGGTRTAAVTGGCVALALACRRLVARRQLAHDPLGEMLAAVSVGLVGGQPLLDLDYSEDVEAEVDMNVVMTEGGRFVELQGTAEHRPFARDDLDALCDLATRGIRELNLAQRRALESVR